MKRRGTESKDDRQIRHRFAEDDWHGLRNHLLEKKFSEDLMFEAGLVSRSKGRTFDKFGIE